MKTENIWACIQLMGNIILNKLGKYLIKVYLKIKDIKIPIYIYIVVIYNYRYLFEWKHYAKIQQKQRTNNET